MALKRHHGAQETPLRQRLAQTLPRLTQTVQSHQLQRMGWRGVRTDCVAASHAPPVRPMPLQVPPSAQPTRPCAAPPSCLGPACPSPWPLWRPWPSCRRSLPRRQGPRLQRQRRDRRPCHRAVVHHPPPAWLCTARSVAAAPARPAGSAIPSASHTTAAIYGTSILRVRAWQPRSLSECT